MRKMLVDEVEIVKILAMRTGMDENTIHTIIHFLQRTILHHVKVGDDVRFYDFFTIHQRNNEVEITLTESAKRKIKSK